MYKNSQAKIVLVLYGIASCLWILFVSFSHYSSTLEGPIYHFLLQPFLVLMTAIPLFGGMFGLLNSRYWGGYKSTVGGALVAFSLGLIAWGGGMIVWNYYLFFTPITVPYPSLADSIFILSWPLWALGIFELSKAIGARFALRQKKGWFILLGISLVTTLLSIYLIVYVARGGIAYDNDTAKLFFDLFYPLGDIVILSITTTVYLLSRRYLGGMYKTPTLILLIGFVMNYFSDFIFSYTTTQGTYFNGHFVDFLFVTTMFVLSLSLAMFTPRLLDSHTTPTSQT